MRYECLAGELDYSSAVLEAYDLDNALKLLAARWAREQAGQVS